MKKDPKANVPAGNGCPPSKKSAASAQRPGGNLLPLLVVEWSAGRQTTSAAAECSNNCANDRSNAELFAPADAWTVVSEAR